MQVQGLRLPWTKQGLELRTRLPRGRGQAGISVLSDLAWLVGSGRAQTNELRQTRRPRNLNRHSSAAGTRILLALALLPPSGFRPRPPRPVCRHFLWVCLAKEKMAALGEPVRLERGECGGCRGRGGWSGWALTERLASRSRNRDEVAGALTPRAPPRPSCWALLAGGAGRGFKARQTPPSLPLGAARFLRPAHGCKHGRSPGARCRRAFQLHKPEKQVPHNAARDCLPPLPLCMNR